MQSVSGYDLFTYGKLLISSCSYYNFTLSILDKPVSSVAWFLVAFPAVRFAYARSAGRINSCISYGSAGGAELTGYPGAADCCRAGVTGLSVTGYRADVTQPGGVTSRQLTDAVLPTASLLVGGCHVCGTPRPYLPGATHLVPLSRLIAVSVHALRLIPG